MGTGLRNNFFFVSFMIHVYLTGILIGKEFHTEELMTSPIFRRHSKWSPPYGGRTLLSHAQEETERLCSGQCKRKRLIFSLTQYTFFIIILIPASLSILCFETETPKTVQEIEVYI